MSFVIFRT